MIGEPGKPFSGEFALDIRPAFCNTLASICRQAERLSPDSSRLSSLWVCGSIYERAPVMIQRITKTLLVVAILIGLAQTRSSVCFGWSLLHPFTSNDNPQTTMVSRTTQKPTAWNRFTSGTKNLFNKTGETLGLKKKELKKAPPVVAAKPRTLQPKATQSNSGMMGWLFPKEEKPKDVKGWLNSTKQVTP
jgi:hypothetical protein